MTRSLTRAVLLAALLAGCRPRSACETRALDALRRSSARYVGRWTVLWGDTLTIPEMGDRFKLRELDLDTGHVVVSQGKACRLHGAVVFEEPRRDTFAVTWAGTPEQALIYGWPADLGPFGGIGAKLREDTLVGSLLFQSEVGINVPAGVTARFVARRLAGH
ncbi:MAG TPA: hypothetical protein VLT79_08795 [Gemmatimonadales bacterium]|nr:hypothetical protein [Gemmatimonadales bacterium]